MVSDIKFRMEAAGRAYRANARSLTESELLARLRSFGIELDRPLLKRLCNQHLSAEEIAEPLIAKCAFKNRQEESEGDWIWVCLDALWQRWFPDIPSFEMLDDKIQAGYELLASTGAAAGCPVWVDAWKDVLYFLDKADLHSISEFDRLFKGTQSLFNWIQDLEAELWNAHFEDPQHLTARIAICEEAMRRFEAGDNLMTQNHRRALAESYCELGETRKADELYRQWLGTDPQWGWGWIGWSDCYRGTHFGLDSSRKAEEILREGLSIAGVRDFKYLAGRLSDLYKKQGRADEAKEIERQAEMKAPAAQHTIEILQGGKVLRQKTSITFEGDGLPLSDLHKLANLQRVSAAQVTGKKHKIGRNEPCPCGSGQKFKKCCIGR